MPSVYFETFGCQMNVADSDMLAQALFARGYFPAQTGADADLIVVNTCSVRERAEVRAKARIAHYASLKKKNAWTGQLWVIGCMAQRLGEALRKQIPGIDRMIGAKEIVSFVGEIDNALPGRLQTPGNLPGNSLSSPVSAFVPVMRGCDNFCSYCVVPYVRGEECSIPYAQVETVVCDLVDKGTKEVTLLGQNVNSYADGPMDFSDLLEKIQALPGISRVRFTTSHPKDCTDKLLRTVARRPKLCRHIHLPVQSGSTRVLDRMNRNYTRETYLRLIKAIRQILPDADITTDAMVGFPSESEEDFADTLSLFKEVRFTAAFMFAYSKRNGTGAADMDDNVSEAIKKERLSRLIALQTEITKNRYAAMVGKELEVLFVEQQRGGKKLWRGQDSGCKRTLLACNENIAGTILKVRAMRSSGMTLITERT
jgi:tRNA-2-methylthio-N6-dimethylallyladenosine synthase